MWTVGGSGVPLFYSLLLALTLQSQFGLCMKNVYPRPESLISDDSSSRITNSDQDGSSSLRYSEDYEEELLRPEAPYWLKPDLMKKSVFAETLNSLVRTLLKAFPLRAYCVAVVRH